MPTVTDLTIQACYNPSATSRLSDVFLYARIDAEPSTTVSLIHLQYQIRGVTLLRVTPLGADGVSPRSTPGVSALKIPVLRRTRTRFSTIGSVKSKPEKPPETYHGEDQLKEAPVERLPVERLAIDRFPLDLSVSPLTPISPLVTTPGAFPMSPGPYQVDDGLSRFFAPARMAPFDGAAAPAGVENQDTLSRQGASTFESHQYDEGSDDQQSIDESEDDECQTLEILRDEGMRPESEDGIRGFGPDMEAMALQQEIATSIDAARMRMSMPVEEAQAPNAWIGSDRSGIFEQSIPRIAIPPAEDMKRFEDPSLEIVEDFESSAKTKMDGAADELLKGVLMRGGDKKWREQVSLTVKDEKVIVCFPETMKASTHVIEVYVRIPLIALGYSTHAFAFVLAGLPQCLNPATLEFLVADDPSTRWQLDASHGKAPFELVGKADGQGIFGKITLDAETPIERSLVIRALQIPTSVEIYDHKIGSWTQLSIHQRPDGTYSAKVVIAIAFYDVTIVEDVSRNLLNIILINCGNIGKDDMHVCNDNGELETFTLDGPVQRDGKVLEGTQLLQLARHPEDVGRYRLWISYDTTVGTDSFKLAIPVAEIGGPEDIMEQTITVRNEVPSLKVRCAVNMACWTYLGKADGSHVLKRLINDEPAEYPSVSASPMEVLNFESPAMAALAAAYATTDGSVMKTIDHLQLDFQEQEPWTSLSVIPLKLCMSFSLNTSKLRDHRELLRAACGEFELDFMTIDGEPVLDGLFLDNGDLVVTNTFRKKPVTAKIANITIYWTARQGLETTRVRGDRNYELLLPQITDTLVMRVGSTFHTNRDIQLISRTYSPPLQAWSAPYISGRATMSGVQTFKANLHLQIKIGKKNISSIKLLKTLIDVEEARLNKERLPEDANLKIEADPEVDTVTSYQTLPSCTVMETAHGTAYSLASGADRSRGTHQALMDGAKSEARGSDTAQTDPDEPDKPNTDATQIAVKKQNRMRKLSANYVLLVLICIGMVGYCGFNRLLARERLPAAFTIPDPTLTGPADIVHGFLTAVESQPGFGVEDGRSVGEERYYSDVEDLEDEANRPWDAV